MFSHTNRLPFATLALVIVLAASACSKKKSEPQSDAPSAQSTTAGSTPSQASTAPGSPSTHGHPMDPGMKDHDHPMGPGMEGDADKHNTEHP